MNFQRCFVPRSFSPKIPFGPHDKFDKAFQLVWKMGVPYKIKAFGWMLLINRLPTKDLLSIRGISFPIDSQKCISCGNADETLDHSFLFCYVIILVWRDIAEWIGFSDFPEIESKGSFMKWYKFCKLKKVKKEKEGCDWLAIT
ncbi:unnamed protein product [Vicia faba]|uniref:Reverse transcriptase zinc-binding domain-containing protein n=1 Tax=Vicia faba TaxID=3906 RepID=A0AAV0YWA5_VICFA|nr:unnamed protein product [Vicia faba]